MTIQPGLRVATVQHRPVWSVGAVTLKQALKLPVGLVRHDDEVARGAAGST